MGFTFPLRDMSRQHRWTGFPHPAPSLRAVSHDLEGLICLRPCRFISPGCHVQGSPTRNSNSHRPDDSSPPGCPLVVSDCLLPPVARQRHIQSPRPQGFSLYESPGTKATVFSRHLGPLPRRFILLQVLSLADSETLSRPHRSQPCARTVAVVPCADPQRFVRRRAWLPSPEGADLLEVSGLPAHSSFRKFRLRGLLYFQRSTSAADGVTHFAVSVPNPIARVFRRDRFVSRAWSCVKPCGARCDLL